MPNWTLRMQMWVWGVDPVEVTARMGVEPTFSTIAGERLIPGGRPRRFTKWALDSPAGDENSSIEAQWHALKAALAPGMPYLRTLPRDSIALLVEAIAIEDEPPIIVPVDLSKFLVEFEIDLDITIGSDDRFIEALKGRWRG